MRSERTRRRSGAAPEVVTAPYISVWMPTEETPYWKSCLVEGQAAVVVVGDVVVVVGGVVGDAALP